MWAGAYECALVRMLRSFLKPGMVFLDLGANIGYFSAIAAALVGTSGRVFAFEPSPHCFTYLERNLRGFEQAAIYNCAVSDTNGPRPFYLHPAENGWGSLFADRGLTERIHIDTIRLDDWAQKVAIQRLASSKSTPKEASTERYSAPEPCSDASGLWWLRSSIACASPDINIPQMMFYAYSSRPATIVNAMKIVSSRQPRQFV